MGEPTQNAHVSSNTRTTERAASVSGPSEEAAASCALSAIREGIRKFQAREKGADGIEYANTDVDLSDDDAESVRQQLARFYRLEKAISAVDTELSAAVEQMGKCPPGPPTLRARFGRSIIGFVNLFLNRLFWWKSEETRRLGALVLRLTRLQADQLGALAAVLGERSRRQGSSQGALQAELALRSRVEALEAELGELALRHQRLSALLAEVRKRLPPLDQDQQ
ncbi:MAG TPA: hypothetical protein VKV15_26990 [Bryobacteraceae bacterium]|nr:hypothetical protein [Bryobacteraceae bacterium]